jgi:hypothetical protein
MKGGFQKCQLSNCPEPQIRRGPALRFKQGPLFSKLRIFCLLLSNINRSVLKCHAMPTQIDLWRRHTARGHVSWGGFDLMVAVKLPPLCRKIATVWSTTTFLSIIVLPLPRTAMFILNTAAPCVFPAAAPLPLLPCCCGAARIGLCGTTPLITYVNTEQRWNNIKRENFCLIYVALYLSPWRKTWARVISLTISAIWLVLRLNANRRGDEP